MIKLFHNTLTTLFQHQSISIIPISKTLRDNKNVRKHRSVNVYIHTQKNKSTYTQRKNYRICELSKP